MSAARVLAIAPRPVLIHSRRVDRCFHLADEERGRIARLPYQVMAELCCLCGEEWQARLKQLPDHSQAEMEAQGQEISRAFEQHQQRRAGCWD